MCGIAGVIGHIATADLLNKMLARISHRGEKLYQQENIILDAIAIGMNRLAIVDEQHGMQPFSNDDGIFCIFNGEIYNHDALREELSNSCSFATKCDTEVVLHSYLYWGEDFISKLDGKYALCIIDSNTNKFILARDHAGIKPLYYAEYADSILFSSEIKSFCEVSSVDTIKMLPPGSIMINGITKKYYDIPEYAIRKSTATQKILNELRSSLVEAVRKRIPTESKKISCLLSGGLDSSIILYIASKLHNNVEAFTFANQNKCSSDLDAASRLCKELNINHIIVSPPEDELMNFYLTNGVYLTESYEPVLVRNAVSYHYVCKAVRAQAYKFVLNGEGADELFGGYAFFKEIDLGNRDAAIRLSLLNLHKTYLQMADRASMFSTLEARVPYMDKDLINYCMTLPADFRINGEQDKWALRQIFKDELPDYIVMRPKTGMNEGAGFGRNRPSESIYYNAVKNHYEQNRQSYELDLSICRRFASKYKINMDVLEEIYNFSRYVEYGYIRYDLGHQRLQLNTQLIKE